MIKLDRSGWARKLLHRSERARLGLSSRRRRRSMSTEALEDRCLLTPVIDDATVSLPEHSPDGTLVFDVNDFNTGNDFDVDGDPITYSIIGGDPGGAFMIDGTFGTITVDDHRKVNHETNPVFNLIVEADDGVETPDTAIIQVNLQDLNEDIRLISAYLTDGNGAQITSPLVGEMIGIEVNYSTENLLDPSDYRIGYTIDGVPLSTEGIENGEGEYMTPPQFWTDNIEGWYATGGTHTVVVTLDADGTVGEDDEVNNVFSFTFTSQTASPPVQFAWPTGGTPQDDMYITAYVDIDPTTDDNTRDDEEDYNGGFHTRDENEGWLISPPTFHDQDKKIPVYAAADGVVVDLNDGMFDRENLLLDPLPDPIPDTNRITIAHGDGYTTTYSHLRMNSVWLRVGDPVVEGQLIGLVGSSGPFADEPGLHWKVERYGRPIETLLDPNVYLIDPPDYSGSFNYIRRSFFTQCLPTHPFQPCPNPTNFDEPIPYDFTAHMLEGPSSVPYFTVTGNQPITVFAEFGTVRPGDALEAVWINPHGVEHARDQANTIVEDYSAEFWWRQFMPPEPIQGVWTVEFYQNGAKIGEDSFSVQFEEFPDARIEQQSLFFPARLDFPEEIYVDERYTPVDLDMPGGGALGNGTQDETWTIHNQGTANLVTTAITVPEAFEFDVYDKGGFLITTFPGAASYLGGNVPLTALPGSSVYLRVGPQPGLDPGYYSGMVRIFTNDPEEQDYNISIESRIPANPTQNRLEIGIAARDIFENPVSGDLVTRLVANVRRYGPDSFAQMGDDAEELVVDLVAELSDVTFPGNVRIPANADYASFYIETFNDDKIEGVELLRVGAVDRNLTNTYDPAFTTIRIVDDDLAGLNIVESDGDTVVDENGSTDSFEVTLTAEPISPVVIDISTTDPFEAIAGPTRLTFTPLTWDIPQTVTVTGIDDAETDGTVVSNVVLAINDFLSDNAFDPLEDTLVPVSTIDNDIPGFLITEPDGDTIVDETGTTDTFEMRLTKQPTFNVLFDITPGDLGEATTDVGSLVFTPANWDTPQIVTVTGIDDVQVDGSISSSIDISVRVLGSDPDWAAVPSQSVSVTTTDDEVAGFTITESAGTTIVNETGTTDTFEVVLDHLPLTDVRLQFVVNDASEIFVSPATVRFTKNNGTTPRTITVTGLDDTFVDGNQVTSITVSVIDAQSNNFFDPLPDQTVIVTNVDDDIPDITIIGGPLEVGEDGTNDSFQVVLNSEPASNVKVDLQSLDTTEFTIAPTSLLFTPADWDTPRLINVTHVDDADTDGDITSQIQIAVDDTMSDAAYHGVADKFVNVKNIDDEVAEIIAVESGPGTEVSETGTTDTIDVTLTSPPLASVELEVLVNDNSEITVTPSTLTFTGGNFNVAQTITVMGVDDDFVDGDILSNVTIRVVDANSHSAFHPAADQIVNVTTLDDEVAGITITETSGDTIVSETGTTDTVTVVLDGAPAGDVVIDVAVSDGSEASADVSTLTFTSADWDQPQTITITGLNDDLADGDIASQLDLTVDDGLSDDFFDGITASVGITTTDDDVASFTVTETGSNTLAREGGNNDSVLVVLTAAPLTTVTIDVTSQDPTEMAVLTASVTFDGSNWDIPQTVTFSAVDDADMDDKNFTIADFVVNGGSDAMFLGETAQVTVATVDDDAPVFIDDTDLVINGTSNADTIDVSQIGTSVTVSLNAVPFVFDISEFDRIFIEAKNGNDLVTASTSTRPLLVKGQGGNDTVLAGQGSDTVRGGGGNDVMHGDGGGDSLNGGSGADELNGGLGPDSLQAGRGSDTLNGGDGSDLMQGQGGKDTLVGGAGADTMGGNERGDSLDGGTGNDVLRGGEGNDTIFGGTGVDEITGGSGQDRIEGQGDQDLIVGGSGNDTIRGNSGNDVLIGGADVDVINGDSGEDLLIPATTSLSLTHLNTILAEWNSANSYLQRVDNIHDGPNQTQNRLNTAFLIGPNRPSTNQTAFDDGSRDELTGDDDLDFFYANLATGDNLNDNSIFEWVDQL